MNTSVKGLFLVYSVDGLRCFCITSVKYPTEGDWYNFINSPSFRVNWYFFDTIFLLPWPQRFFFSPYCFATHCLCLAVRSLFHEQKNSRKASGTKVYFCGKLQKMKKTYGEFQPKDNISTNKYKYKYLKITFIIFFFARYLPCCCLPFH